jgi:phenylalanyl-tRNA synthetase beta chain
VKLDRILTVLPFIGLDIEAVDNDNVRIEYNPNRPDFSSEVGVVRALKGLLEIEIGLPKFKLSTNDDSSGYIVKVDPSVKHIRPHIVSLIAKKEEEKEGGLSNESLGQLISMQEDLHNGIGRRRKKASIGIHNLDRIKFPITYTTAEDNFSFIPLDKSVNYTIKQILSELDTGKQYGYILRDTKRYPIIIDAENSVLSFPPIVNSNATKIKADTQNLFVEITANNKQTAEDTIAIIAMTLFDTGFEIQTVTINDIESGYNESTPNMQPAHLQIDANYINEILGLNLNINRISFSLKKCRLGTEEAHDKRILCIIPRYRSDVIHRIDIVEEVAIGYGIDNFKPRLPCSKTSGGKSDLTAFFDVIREVMIGLGMLEVVNFSLVSKKMQFDLMGIKEKKEEDPSRKTIEVDGAKSNEHQFLRDSLIPSLLQTLSHNVHEEYPQRLFEIGKVFELTEDMTIHEYWNIGIVIAHNSAGYTEAKSVMQEVITACGGSGGRYAAAITTKAAAPSSLNSMFIEGRCADIVFNGKNVGVMGEIAPLVIENFRLRVPVSALELNLSYLIGR